MASITVNNATDLVSPTADTSSITALVANDGGDGVSLREAIAATNNTLGEDTITFDGSVFTGGASSLIRLTQDDLDVTETLTIDASTAIDVTITGDANGDDITLPGTFITDVVASFGSSLGSVDDLMDDNSRVLDFSSTTGDLTLTDLSVTGGRTQGVDFIPELGFVVTPAEGAGIRFLSDGGLTLEGSKVSGNIANGPESEGGGIYTFAGTVSLNNSTVSGNSTANGGDSFGGGIYTSTGAVILINSTVSGNNTSSLGSAGAGIYTSSGSVTLTNSVVSGNNAKSNFSSGGGIRTSSGSVNLTNSLVSGNESGGHGGGISTSSGSVFLTDSTVRQNEADLGGGIGTSSGSVILTNSTVSDNGGEELGGGINSISGSVNLSNSTVSGNRSSSTVAGIRAGSGDVTLTNSTVSDNTGNGIYLREGHLTLSNATVTNNTRDGISMENVFPGTGVSVSIMNSIVAGNTQGRDLNLASEVTVTVGYSLIGATDLTISGTGNQIGTLANPINPLLGPLADNGGPTLTHALLANSPAIDAGSNSFAVDSFGVSLANDQRGDGFARIDSGTVDIGAFEVQSAVPIPPVVVSVKVDEGGVLARPDLWNTLTVVFDADVTVAAEDLVLFNDSLGGVEVALSGVGFSYDSSNNTASWDFSTLADPLDAAFYTYQLDADSITSDGLPLDGNNDGTGDDDFVTEHYVAIPGDTNLDGVVDVLSDAFALVGNLGSTTNLAWADGNLNGDGIVDVIGDAFVVVANLGRDVRPPVAAASFTTSQSQAAMTSTSSSVAAVLSLVPSNNADDQDEVTDAASLTTPRSQSPTLVLAGDHELRDDVFGSEF